MEAEKEIVRFITMNIVALTKDEEKQILEYLDEYKIRGL